MFWTFKIPLLPVSFICPIFVEIKELFRFLKCSNFVQFTSEVKAKSKIEPFYIGSGPFTKVNNLQDVRKVSKWKHAERKPLMQCQYCAERGTPLGKGQKLNKNVNFFQKRGGSTQKFTISKSLFTVKRGFKMDFFNTRMCFGKFWEQQKKFSNNKFFLKVYIKIKKNGDPSLSIRSPNKLMRSFSTILYVPTVWCDTVISLSWSFSLVSGSQHEDRHCESVDTAPRLAKLFPKKALEEKTLLAVHFQNI